MKEEILYIKKGDGTSFFDAKLESYTFSDASLGFDTKIEGSFVSEVRLQDEFTMQEYIEYQTQPTGNKTKFYLINRPIQTRSGDMGGKDKGLYRYACKFNTPSIELLNMPLYDKISQNRTFSWFGSAKDLIDLIKKSLTNTWSVSIQDDYVLSTKMLEELISFNNATIADGFKTLYDKFKVSFNFQDRVAWVGKPVFEIPHEFSFGNGLKSENITPKNNDIITKVFPIGTDKNIPYPYPKMFRADGVTQVTTYWIKEKDFEGNDIRTAVPLLKNTLMPSIYRSTLQAQIDFYDANGWDYTGLDFPEVKDYYLAQGVDFPTQYNSELPLIGTYEETEVYPSIEGMTYKGQAIDVLKMVNFPQGDSDEINTETGEVLYPTFAINLHPMGFDLWAAAAARKAMSFSMRSGDCIGAEFKVQVSEEHYLQSFYDIDENGKYIFNPNKEGRDYSRFPDTTNNSEIILVEKDLDTFGVLRPLDNPKIAPKANDKFVILGIELPENYIKDAEQEMSGNSIEWLKESNYPHYEYPLKLDEGFLWENESIARVITTNALMKFAIGGGKVKKLPIQNITKKYLSGAITTYDVKLTDELAVTINAVNANASKIEEQELIYRNNAFRGATNARFNNYATQKAINGIFDSEGNNRVDKVETLALFANAAIIGQDPNNFVIRTPIMVINSNTNLVTLGQTKIEHLWAELPTSKEGDDKYNWYIDTEATFSLDPSKLYYVYVKAGKTTTSALWDVSSEQRTFNIDGSFFYFVAGQLINIGGIWAYVGTNGITTILGGTITTHITKSPNFKLSESEFVGMMIDFLNARIYMGDGAAIVTRSIIIRPPTGEEIDVQENLDKALADALAAQEAADAVAADLASYESESDKRLDANELRLDGLDSIATSLQSQIDGAITSYLGDEVPTLTNYPAKDWATDAERDKHIGDYYDKETTNKEELKAYDRYRFGKLGSDYSWSLIADNGNAEALNEAREALGIANSKNKVIYSSGVPPTPYYVNDLWIKTSDENPIYLCVTAKASGSGDSKDWQLINDAMLQLGNLADDGIITKTEKIKYKEFLDGASKEMDKFREDATEYGITFPTTLTAAYNELARVTNSVYGCSNMSTDTTLSNKETDKATYALANGTYTTEKIRFANDIAKKISDEAVEDIHLGGANLWDEANLRPYSGILERLDASYYQAPIVRNLVDSDTAYASSIGIALKEHISLSDDEYTLSFWYNVQSVSNIDRWNSYITIEHSDGSRANIFIPNLISPNEEQNKWHKVVLTFKANEGKSLASLVNFYMYADDNDGSSSEYSARIDFYMTVPMLEEGNKPSAWQPSLKDTQDKIDAAQAAAQAAQSDIDAMNQDGVFSRIEKTSIKDNWFGVQGVANTTTIVTSSTTGNTGSYITALKQDKGNQEAGVVNQAKQSLTTAYNALRVYLNTWKLYTDENTGGSFDRDVLDQYFTNYFNAEKNVYKVISKGDKGQDGANGKDGQKGDKGEDGADGQDGKSLLILTSSNSYTQSQIDDLAGTSVTLYSISPTYTAKAGYPCQVRVTNSTTSKYAYVMGIINSVGSTGITVACTSVLEDGANGEDGQDGQDGVGITSTTITYAAASQGETPPANGWVSNIPNVRPKWYLWTRTIAAYSNGTSLTSYSVARQGADGQDIDESTFEYLKEAFPDGVSSFTQGLSLAKILAVSVTNTITSIKAFLSGLDDDSMLMGGHPENAYNICRAYLEWIKNGKIESNPTRPNLLITEDGTIYANAVELGSMVLENGNFVFRERNSSILFEAEGREMEVTNKELESITSPSVVTNINESTTVGKGYAAVTTKTLTLATVTVPLNAKDQRGDTEITITTNVGSLKGGETAGADIRLFLDYGSREETLLDFDIRTTDSVPVARKIDVSTKLPKNSTIELKVEITAFSNFLSGSTMTASVAVKGKFTKVELANKCQIAIDGFQFAQSSNSRIIFKADERGKAMGIMDLPDENSYLVKGQLYKDAQGNVKVKL